MRIIFHGLYDNGAREILGDESMRDDVATEISVPEGTKYIQIFPGKVMPTQLTEHYRQIAERIVTDHITDEALLLANLTMLLCDIAERNR